MKDKVIVITGAGRGLGKAIASLSISHGAIVIISDKDEKNLNLVALELQTEMFLADVVKDIDIQNLAKYTISKFGKIDIWINNAGIWMPQMQVEDINMIEAHKLVEVNLFGTIYGSIAALIQMKKQGFGNIVNIISTSALQGRPLSSVYSASKHAVKGFTDSLREEVKDAGINVISIYPGGIKTNLFDKKKPSDFNDYMSVDLVAEKIVQNLIKDNPDKEMIIKRPGQ